jgi:hypothetical protein
MRIVPIVVALGSLLTIAALGRAGSEVESVLPRGQPATQLAVRLSFKVGDEERILGLPSDRATVAILFHRSCPYCADQLGALETSRAWKADLRVVLLSVKANSNWIAQEWPELAASSTVGVVDAEAAHAFFGTLSTPAIAVIHSNGVILRRFVGYTSVGEMLSEMHAAR